MLDIIDQFFQSAIYLIEADHRFDCSQLKLQPDDVAPPTSTEPSTSIGKPRAAAM
jgi:hypothetical protein